MEVLGETGANYVHGTAEHILWQQSTAFSREEHRPEQIRAQPMAEYVILKSTAKHRTASCRIVTLAEQSHSKTNFTNI